VHRRVIVASALSIGILAAVLPVQAQSSFTVDPLLISLSAQNPSAVLSITNPTDRPMRFEIKGFKWDQPGTAGAMQLTPSSDIVIFPPLITIKPRMTQRIRLGTTAAFGPLEKNYRIMIEELPGDGAPAARTQVMIRTRVGLPVFLQSTTPTSSATIDQVRVANRTVTINFTNTGSTHVLLDEVVVRGMTAADEMIFEGSLQGWYVLAGKSRSWEYPLKPAQCRTTKVVEIEVFVNDALLTARATVPVGACIP